MPGISMFSSTSGKKFFAKRSSASSPLAAHVVRYPAPSRMRVIIFLSRHRHPPPERLSYLPSAAFAVVKKILLKSHGKRF
jgi:hypothetical protein